MTAALTARTPLQVTYDKAFAAAAAVHEAVMAPARVEYERVIAETRQLGKDARIPAADLAAWRDAYARAGEAFGRVMTERGFPEGAS